MSEALKTQWAETPPEKKRKIVVASLFVGLIGLAYMYWSVAKAPEAGEKQQDDYKPIAIGEEMFKDDLSQSFQRTRHELEQQNKARDAKLNNMEDMLKGVKEQLETLQTDPLKPPTLDVANLSTGLSGFPPPPAFSAPSQTSSEVHELSSLEAQSPIIIGAIGHIEGEKLTDAAGKDEKKKVKKVYLPPSFMDAILLTGLDASTVEGANAHPQPFMIRVQEPAVLPNSVKANLKGCFVIAHGYGALNSERIESRLVSLNCLGEDGQAVIDTQVKGYVTDSDGKSGLKGIVVSKQGAALARVFVAGVIGGFGQVAEAAANTVTIAPATATSTTTTDPNRLLTAGLGAGIADSSKELRKFYLDLAKQASPVIEVGPAKKITVVITEGVWIEIRENKDV